MENGFHRAVRHYSAVRLAPGINNSIYRISIAAVTGVPRIPSSLPDLNLNSGLAYIDLLAVKRQTASARCVAPAAPFRKPETNAAGNQFLIWSNMIIV